MALADFVIVPLTSATDETVRINKYSIIDVRVINGGATQAQAENWYIQVNVLLGKSYLLVGTYTDDGGTPIYPPYVSKTAAIAAMEAFLATF
jgi:hypothetical protein